MKKMYFRNQEFKARQFKIMIKIIAALFTIAKMRKKPGCPPTDER